MIVPVLFKPKLLGFKNRFFHGEALRKRLNRDIVLVALSALIVAVIFSGSLEFFKGLNTLQDTVVIHPRSIVSVFFTVLIFMLLLSNTIGALSALYLSKDIEYLLASPIKTSTFFLGKALDTFQSASWMLAVFALPTVIAFIYSYSLSLFQSLAVVLVCLLLISLPVIWSMGVAVLFARLFPLQQVRRLLFLMAVFAIAGIYILIQLVGGATPGDNRSEVLTSLLSHITHPAYRYLPSHWAAIIVGEIASETGTKIIPYWIGIISLFVGSIAVVFILIKKYHHSTFSISKVNKAVIQINSKAGHARFTRMFFFLSPATRALVSKDIKMFARDMGQALQLIMLIGLCAIYLYNFGAVSKIAESSDGSLPWWQPALTIINIAMGCFVITAVCSRFVFPSISLEGKALWIITTSPLSPRQILNIKFWLWYVPVGIISIVILGSGALAVQAPIHIVMATIFISVVSAYGIVGLGTGFGALFAFFDWENSSQLSANLGSLIFMITSMLLVFFSLIPIGIALFLVFAHSKGYLNSSQQMQLSVAAALFLFTYLNILAKRWSFSAGITALERKKF